MSFKIKWVIIAILLVPALVQAENTYLRTALKSTDLVWKNLSACGLRRLAATDPRLPYPRTTADSAVVNRSGMVLAYYYEDLNFGRNLLQFTNPNGSNPHTVQYGANSISYTTPRGHVADGTDYQYRYQKYYRFRCFQRTVGSWAAFETCIQNNWIKVISTQLCRYR